VKGERPVGVRQQQKQRTREDLLAAARRLLAERGLAGTTSRAVAQEAGVAAGTFFVHFPDVEALMEALLDEHLGEALASAHGTMPARGDLVDKLVHVSRCLYESYDRDPALSRAVIAGSLFQARRGGPADARLAELAAWAIPEIQASLGPGSPLDPALAFNVFFSLYFGTLVAGLRGDLSREAQVASLDAALRRFFGMEG
jgi:AcrR family transcriptional regulator